MLPSSAITHEDGSASARTRLHALSWRERLPSIWRGPALVLAALLLVAAGEYLLGRGVEPTEVEFALAAPDFGPPDYRAQRESLENRLDLDRQRVARAPDEWLPRASLASAWLADFRVTGRAQSMAMAQREYSLVQSLAPDPAGAPLALADFALATHDIVAAKSALDVFSRSAVPPTPVERSEAFAMRSDIAFYDADFSAARRYISQAEELAPGVGIDIRQALLLRSTGEFDRALARLAAASNGASRTPLMLASIALQAGVIESSRGNHPKAREWYETADRLFPGYWLTRLHLAESQLVAGEDQQAIAALENIVEQSPRPEAMDMLALIYRVKGRRAQSLQWSGRASAIWRELVAEFPDAYGAHAAEHELVFGDPKRALALAVQNRRTRPYGEARILLANALIANGRPNRALEELFAAEDSGWRSATLHAAKAQAFEMLGRADNAQNERELALDLNPEIFADRTRMVWLAHG